MRNWSGSMVFWFDRMGAVGTRLRDREAGFWKMVMVSNRGSQ